MNIDSVTRSDMFKDDTDGLKEFVSKHNNIRENKYISTDIQELKKHYSIMLGYVKELEKKLSIRNEQITSLQKTIEDLINNVEEDDFFEDCMEELLPESEE